MRLMVEGSLYGEFGHRRLDWMSMPTHLFRGVLVGSISGAYILAATSTDIEAVYESE